MEPYIGMIGIFAFDFVPRGWLKCEGQVLPIDQYQTLYSLIGNIYGGDGRSTFALPDLRGRVPLHMGNGFSQGWSYGYEGIPLTVSNLPSHTHNLYASSTADSGQPSGKMPAKSEALYHEKTTETVQMNPACISSEGGNNAHENRQPFLALTFAIANEGTYPSRN